jgi:hypothetical protein
MSRRARRRGASLVELLIVIVLISAALGLAVPLVELLVRVGNAAPDHLERVTRTTRLAAAFRADVRGAATAEDATAEKRLRLAGGPTEVTYHIERDHLVRLEREGERIVGREAYALDERPVAWRIERDPGTGATFVALVLDRRLTARRKVAPRQLRIEARLGADRPQSHVGGSEP